MILRRALPRRIQVRDVRAMAFIDADAAHAVMDSRFYRHRLACRVDPEVMDYLVAQI